MVFKNKNSTAVFLALYSLFVFSVGSFTPWHAFGSSGLSFFSPNDLPNGVKSLEPLFGKLFWNGWVNNPPEYAANWPACLKWESPISQDQSAVFLPDPAAASEQNVNARNQKCEIPSGKPIFLTVYPGECDDGTNPGNTPSQLLACAQDANRVIKLMQVSADGVDVSSKIVRQSTTKPFTIYVPPINVYDAHPPETGQHLGMAESYYLFFKPLPVGDHTIKLEVIRQPLQLNQPIEHDVAQWNIRVVP